MKMKYEKPMVAVDRYELSQSIAGCENIKVSYTDSGCFLLDPDVPFILKSHAMGNLWFADDTCGNVVVEGEVLDGGAVYDGFCYHTQANSVLVS